MKTATEQANLAENTVRRFFDKIHERIAEDVTTKFGKQKYHYGRMVEGTWVLGGIQPSFPLLP